MDLNCFHRLPEPSEGGGDDSVSKLSDLFPMANKTNVVVEAPPTPGRPVFSFSVGPRKNFPSKWDDAQKWLISPPRHKTPISVYGTVSVDHHVLVKDKLTNGEEHKFKCVVPIKEGFLMKDASTEVVQQHQGCPTPYKSVSPPRHTTPASMSGPLALSSSFDIAGCKLLPFESCNWSSREEEEEDVSKSLRHFECPKTIPPCAWDKEEKARSHLRYQREEAKIQAWVNLQNAKAEAQSRKLEVKIQKMRSKFEEKMMKRMASVDRKAEELRAAALSVHNMQPPKSTMQNPTVEFWGPKKLRAMLAFFGRLEQAENPLLACFARRASSVHKYSDEAETLIIANRELRSIKPLNSIEDVSNQNECRLALKSICLVFQMTTEYDRGVNTFSPEGRLFQVEYAIEAIKLGSTAIGLKTKEGVVLAVEKRITSPLLEPSSVEKIMEIDEHIGCAMSGLIADARTLVEHARVETQNHRFSYGEPMTVESTTQALCDLALRFGEGDEESMSRPFGVSLLIAGHDENGPSLYYTDPSGTFWQCNAKAIGSGSEGADSSLQEQFNKDLTLKEAETIALSILKQVMEEKVTPNNVDIAKVAPTYHLYTPAEVEAVISRL
ncbi:hypothetical protein L1987_45365 [Smallanthus sonchifolius]|uniref:Uncharacterized protein n=1 Tax=Smallanthus sonchifolius TaxID=185202 RepID=A0ACB9GTD1_9ASTR|nr:hypothetical protein L1987_45365 [Smallanthus sonchifolius]